MRKSYITNIAAALILTSTTLLFSCSHKSIRKEKMDLSFKTNQKINTDLNKNLSSNEINQDLDFLIYALDNAYSGSKKLPNSEYKTLMNELNSLRQEQTVESLGKSIAKSFIKVSDNHLGIYFKKSPNEGINFKELFESKPAWDQVGKNIAGDQTWKVETKQVNNKQITIIGITRFPIPNSKLWEGYEDSIKKILKSSSVLILDLRGNAGGDDNKGGWLAKYINGQEAEIPYDKPFDMNTAESFTIMSNSQLIINALNAKPIEAAGVELSNKLKDFATRVSKGEKVDIREEFANSAEGSKNANLKTTPFKGDIYILMDRRSGSSGESTIDFFENIPRVKKVGQNTAGYIHFGNNGFILLPHSSLLIQIATSFNAYKDGRFIEKVGIKPDIYIGSGKNALDEVIKLIH